jgi:hypothetical protein
VTVKQIDLLAFKAGWPVVPYLLSTFGRGDAYVVSLAEGIGTTVSEFAEPAAAVIRRHIDAGCC